jgi:PKD domain-containing protein
MPDAHFEHDTAFPVTLVPGQTMDVGAFVDFDPNNSVAHFRYMMYATQAIAEAFYHFKVEFYNEAMDIDNPASDWQPFVVQDGWIGDEGESWGFGIEPENQVIFVSDHDYYGTEETVWNPPYHAGAIYEAEDGGTSWQSNVVEEVAKETHLPAGGTWFIRFSLGEDAPGNITLFAFSLDFAYQEWYPRQIAGPIPLADGWYCNFNGTFEQAVYLIVHRGFAYLYGEMFDWLNWNEETDAEWFTNVYDDVIHHLVAPGGIPEAARPLARTEIPIRFYDFDRTASVLGMDWELSANPDGSITFVNKDSGRPDKLRVGGGSYSFAPMQVRWPIGDPSIIPESSGSAVIETHNEMRNSEGQSWTVDHDIVFTRHGGITHMQGGVHHSASSYMDTPLFQTGGILSDGNRIFRPVKVLDDSPGVGQDFVYIQQMTLEITNVHPGDTVEFDASPSKGQQPLTYEWNFGDGETGTGKTISHTYEDGGNYWVKLKVTDPRDRTDAVRKRPRRDVPEGVVGQANDWATYVSDTSGVINGDGWHPLFMAANPETQVFKGSDVAAGSLPGAPGTHFVGADLIDDYFTLDKNFLGEGRRQASIEVSSPQIPYDTASVIGRKYGAAICVQEDGSHYRHEVECTSISGGWPSGRPNTYTHKLFKCIGGTSTQVGSTVTNDRPDCKITALISFSDVEQVEWNPSPTSATIVVNNNEVPKSGTFGYFFTSGVTINGVTVLGTGFPSYPQNDEVVNFDVWWPCEYEYLPDS